MWGFNNSISSSSSYLLCVASDSLKVVDGINLIKLLTPSQSHSFNEPKFINLVANKFKLSLLPSLTLTTTSPLPTITYTFSYTTEVLQLN